MNNTSWGPRIRPAFLAGMVAALAVIALALSL
jgi:hypothetical protein